MTKPGQRQRVTTHRVIDPRAVSPNDVRPLELQRDQRLANDRLSAAQVYLGEQAAIVLLVFLGSYIFSCKR